MKAPTSGTVLAALETLRTFLQASSVSTVPSVDRPAFYTSRGLPPGVSRRRFNEIARGLPAARKDGRVWVVPAAAWEACRSQLARSAGKVATTMPWTPEHALQQAGLRVVAGGAR